MTGLLWYDASTERDLAEKVRRAARRYRQKFGVPPNVCHVHPSALAAVLPGATTTGPMRIGGVEVTASSTTLLHHFLIGCKEADSAIKKMAQMGH